MLRHIRTLASDEFAGRAPGTDGEVLTVRYLSEQLRAMGLRPAGAGPSGAASGDGSFTQPVPLIGITSHPNFLLEVGGKRLQPAFPDDYVAVSRRSFPHIDIDKSELVFVGYGVTAPEYGWDDYKGSDLRGKTLIMLVGDPAIPDPKDPNRLDDSMFQGAAMTYYGRWTYKYETASKLGAAAALIIHETDPAGYPYGVVRGWGRENFEIDSPESNQQRLAAEGWLSLETAKALLAASGHDLTSLKKAALRKDFKPIPLTGTATLRIENGLRSFISHNVVAILDGSDPEKKKEAIIYSAHWDHLGRESHAHADETGSRNPQRDNIYNGAIDNASGLAALLEVARKFSAANPRPQHSVLFLAPTAEEFGLLGSRYYVQHPIFPLASTLADINMDMMNLWGRTRSIANISQGMSTLDEILVAVAGEQGRVVKGDPEPVKGYFFRADSFEFAKAGVPVLSFMRPGSDYIGKPANFERDKAADFIAHDYHKVSDDVKKDWDLSGAVEDVELLYRIGQQLDRQPAFPIGSAAQAFPAPDREPSGVASV